MITKVKSSQRSTKKFAALGIFSLFLAFIIPATQANAAPTLTVRQAQTLRFDASQALSPEKLEPYSTDCSAVGYYMAVTPVGEFEPLYEAYESFETEHCLDNASHWVNVFKWDKTSCTFVYSCVIMPHGSPMAPAGEYQISFVLELGGPDPTFIENEFPVYVLGSYFYTFKKVTKEIFPFKDGFADNVVGELDFWNENGEWLTFSPKAKIGLVQGSKTLATTYVKGDDRFSFATNSKLKGKLDVKVLSIPNPAGGKAWVPIGNAIPKVVTKETKLTSISLSAPVQVFPNKDGYLDSARISISSVMTSGKKGKITGTLKIVKGARVVKTFPISAGGTTSVTWDGKISGKIVPGSYVIVASAKGPEGVTIKKTRGIKVNSKKLTYQTVSKTYDAYVAADESQGDSYDPISRFGSSGAARFYSSGDGDLMLVKLSVPMNSATVKWRIRFNGWQTYDGYFQYNPCRNSDCASSFVAANKKGFTSYSSGTTWTPWANIPGRTANFAISSIDWASIYIESFTVEYVTQTLK